jgi:hypothetical protein
VIIMYSGDPQQVVLGLLVITVHIVIAASSPFVVGILLTSTFTIRVLQIVQTSPPASDYFSVICLRRSVKVCLPLQVVLPSFLQLLISVVCFCANHTLYRIALPMINQFGLRVRGCLKSYEKLPIAGDRLPLAIGQHHGTRQVRGQRTPSKTDPRVGRIEKELAAVRRLMAEKIEHVDPILGSETVRHVSAISCE